MTRPWHEERPDLVAQIRVELREKYPNLHLLVTNGKLEVRGTFPVRGPDGKTLDRYRVSIELAQDHPKSLPIVREIGGRLPWHEDYHVERDGTACVLMPDDRWRCFPEQAPFGAYLDGPLHNFFLSQTVHAETGEWPFGCWGHGKDGIYEYYRWLVDTKDDLTVRRFLHILAKSDLKKHYTCPCGSGWSIKHCCIAKIRDLRQKIPPAVASTSIARLGQLLPPYKRSQLR